MKPARHPSNNLRLVEPDGWDEAADGECTDLSVTAAHGVLFSYWRPSLKERLALIFGRKLRLGIFGTAHPPVSLDTL